MTPSTLPTAVVLLALTVYALWLTGVYPTPALP